MKTLSDPIIAEKDAAEAGWCEIYDVYLKAAIATPWGTTSILRLTDLGTVLAFFKPAMTPEADPSAAATYQPWPIRREIVKGNAKFTNDKLRITASNVTTEWAAMIAAVNW